MQNNVVTPQILIVALVMVGDKHNEYLTGLCSHTALFIVSLETHKLENFTGLGHTILEGPLLE